jgi:hypothetical protein
MPSRKQRRRREKLQRHDWEEVYVDEEGRELQADDVRELQAAPPAKGRGKRERAAPAQRRGARTVEPPSWRRTLKRGLLFFPLMLIVIFLVAGSGVSTAGKIAQTFVLMAFFLPFSYFMDSVVWRSYRRRLEKADPKKRP